MLLQLCLLSLLSLHAPDSKQVMESESVGKAEIHRSGNVRKI